MLSYGATKRETASEEERKVFFYNMNIFYTLKIQFLHYASNNVLLIKMRHFYQHSGLSEITAGKVTRID